MPSAFGTNYVPISTADSDTNLQYVAKLLATHICGSDVVIPDLKYTKKDIESMDGTKEETQVEEDDIFLTQPAELNLENCLIDPAEAADLSLDALLRILDTNQIILSKQFKQIHIKAVTKMAVICSDDFRNSK